VFTFSCGQDTEGSTLNAEDSQSLEKSLSSISHFLDSLKQNFQMPELIIIQRNWCERLGTDFIILLESKNKTVM
jgi:hypothetical protein